MMLANLLWVDLLGLLLTVRRSSVGRTKFKTKLKHGFSIRLLN